MFPRTKIATNLGHLRPSDPPGSRLHHQSLLGGLGTCHQAGRHQEFLEGTDHEAFLIPGCVLGWGTYTICKSAHTALAVKACLLGGNSYTKCSITFVNIAVAISALAGGGGQKRFRTETRPQKRFRTETRIRWCFRHFSRIFGCLSAGGYWNGTLGHFGSFPAMEKRPKMKKTLYIARFCRVFGCQSIENTAKTSVLDWRYSKKRVNYRMLDWKHYKNTVKSNVLEGFTAFMAKNV